MRKFLSLLNICVILGIIAAQEVTQAELSPAQRLLQSLGEHRKVIFMISQLRYFRKANEWVRRKHRWTFSSILNKWREVWHKVGAPLYSRQKGLYKRILSPAPRSSSRHSTRAWPGSPAWCWSRCPRCCWRWPPWPPGGPGQAGRPGQGGDSGDTRQSPWWAEIPPNVINIRHMDILMCGESSSILTSESIYMYFRNFLLNNKQLNLHYSTYTYVTFFFDHNWSSELKAHLTRKKKLFKGFVKEECVSQSLRQI